MTDVTQSVQSQREELVLGDRCDSLCGRVSERRVLGDRCDSVFSRVSKRRVKGDRYDSISLREKRPG